VSSAARRRQPFLLTLGGLAAVLVLVALWMTMAVNGDTGATLIPSGKPFVVSVSAIIPGSPAASAGLRTGDTIDLRDLTGAERYRLQNGPSAGQRIVLPVHRHGVRTTVSFTAWSLLEGKFWRDDGWDQVLSVIGELWSVFVAALILWRRRDSTEAQILALVLILANLGVAITPENFWMTSSPACDAIVGAIGFTAITISTVLLATYAAQFARPISRLRNLMTLVAYSIAALTAIEGVIEIAGAWIGTIDPNSWFFAQTVPAITLNVSLPAVTLVCAALAFRDARGGERTRLAWASGSIAVGLVASVLFELAGVFGTFVHAGTLLVDVVTFLVPLGLTYALLNRRLLDVGFVFNRAAVAALLSASGIATFVLIEWALSAYAGRMGTTGVLVVNIIVAIVLGLFAPALYRIAGSAVERVLFDRQRRARDGAARLVAGLPYAESALTIANALTRDLCMILDIPSGAVYRRTGGGRFEREAAAGWDDAFLSPAEVERMVLQLLANRTFLRVNASHPGEEHREQTDGAHAIAFPLEARQELIGFAVYSMHAGGIDIDPDERALLAEAARQASRGYDAIELASRVEVAYRARIDAEAEAKETLRRANANLERINDAQSRFVPTEFLHFLNRASIVDVELGDSTLQTMSVLFSDIRSFTTLSEGMAPPDIFRFLNDYMRRVGPLVREHNGFIDKYIGDAVMGLFPASPSDALRAAVAIQRELRIFNVQLERERKPRIAAGIGIHLGQLMLGTIGERGRMETTVIADAVNAASRLESATKTFGASILISRQAYDALVDPHEFLVRRLGSTYVKGKSQALEVFECFSGETPDAIERRSQRASAFQDALAAFEIGDVDAARSTFADIAFSDATDGPARYYLERCEEITVRRG